MMKIALWLMSVVCLLFGARMTWFMGEGAHVLMHRGSFDAILGFLVLLFASIPFLVCGLLALLMFCAAYDIDANLYDDQEPL